MSETKLSPEVMEQLTAVFRQFMNISYLSALVHDDITALHDGKNSNVSVTTSYKGFEVTMCPGYWLVKPLLQDIAQYHMCLFLAKTLTEMKMISAFSHVLDHLGDEIKTVAKCTADVAAEELKVKYGPMAFNPARLEFLMNLIEADSPAV